MNIVLIELREVRVGAGRAFGQSLDFICADIVL
jgi:hypothetical protein